MEKSSKINVEKRVDTLHNNSALLLQSWSNAVKDNNKLPLGPNL